MYNKELDIGSIWSIVNTDKSNCNTDRSDYSTTRLTLDLWLIGLKIALDWPFLTYFDLEFQDIFQSTSGVMLRE